ncbi:PLP-dependent aspartate aminotransferase family protein [Anaerosalibacter bizertensis]|uniref:L-methionine gamma-lyase n=1 Tax=Anaerosalibacter bizertensis TaxID=932217 RepID=A0A9Q4FK40_9FIRM|nr:PLP-dependent aspartate aminotransferase family protein [Anaerosalibacter bizertensis]MBV1818722.1 PLP-dependent aspartate aminotransferase family protein [Bacteroidales bacterium MSK.15.36]MCB5558821.1 PLP-dependent aspartate aminotransferase family protein [Anaerosalibacter bizertensis]MCG4564171.1 PLP-dependent aspartate aminotransferase family protein [Anaerosalibacter bizertensis]MCG4581848.1 PLP-dependent aspartate aminotransferase family protein [Anaerosalibacter bizertensis]MCG45858
MNKNHGFDTRAIHAGGTGKNPSNALNPPIFQTSTFVFDDIDHVEKVMSFQSDDYVYTRGNNPTLRLFENRMAELEHGEGAVAFASGMAAISSVLFSFLKPNDNVIVHRTLYGSSYSVITKLLPQYGVEHKIRDLTNLENLKEAIDENTKLIYFETPSNPNLSIIDIKKVVEIAKEKDIKVVVDNTFATPYFQNPLELGADVVVHSATKYICGHGDVVGGVAISKDNDYIQRLKFDYMCEFGGVMSPFNAWLLLRGLKTMGLRMRQHEKNAIEVAKFLNNHPKIKTVMYPGLENFKGYNIAKEQMNGFGAMISFEIDGGLKDAIKFVESVKLAQLAVSLGDCETLIEVPAAMTHRGYPNEKLKEFGLTESMVRISVGLEDSEDIIEDLEQALNM